MPDIEVQLDNAAHNQILSPDLYRRARAEIARLRFMFAQSEIERASVQRTLEKLGFRQ